jgi:ribosome maturation factor RimP
MNKNIPLHCKIRTSNNGETESLPFLLTILKKMKLLEVLESAINEELEGTDYFLVQSKVSSDYSQIRFYVDGDEGVSIEKCSSLSRMLSRMIDEQELGDKSFRLEVSSPGADEPLAHPRQFKKHIGRKFNVSLNDGDSFKAILTGITGDEVGMDKIVESKKGKVAKTEAILLSISDIKEIKVILSFK